MGGYNKEVFGFASLFTLLSPVNSTIVEKEGVEGNKNKVSFFGLGYRRCLGGEWMFLSLDKLFLERGVKIVSSPFLPRYVFLTFYFCILPSLFAFYIDIVFNAFWRREEANIKLF